MKLSYAGLHTRIIAFLFDYIILAAYLLLIIGLGAAMNAFFPQAARSLFSTAFSSQLTGFLLVTLPISLYFAISESSRWQASWGKRRRGLRVVDLAGRRIRFPRSLARTLLKFIPWELSHFLIWQVNFMPDDSSAWVTAGFILVWLLVAGSAIRVWMSETKQSFHDWITGTFVVEGRA
jgi:uncharacterized RDD family membrane protein YckC